MSKVRCVRYTHDPRQEWDGMIAWSLPGGTSVCRLSKRPLGARRRVVNANIRYRVDSLPTMLLRIRLLNLELNARLAATVAYCTTHLSEGERADSLRDLEELGAKRAAIIAELGSKA